jgi:hypothetical protein
LSALVLSGLMGFSKSEAKGVRLLLQDMWKPGTFEMQLKNDEIAEIAMGFEPAEESGLAQQKPNQKLEIPHS